MKEENNEENFEITYIEIDGRGDMIYIDDPTFVPVQRLYFRIKREDGVFGRARVELNELIDFLKDLQERCLSVNDWLIYWDDRDYEEVAPGGIVREKKKRI